MASLAAHMSCAKFGRNDTIPLRGSWCKVHTYLRWAKGSAIYPPLKAYGTVGPTIALPAVVRLLAAPKQIETISVSQDHNRAALPLGLTCLRCYLLETHKHGPEHMRDTDIV